MVSPPTRPTGTEYDVCLSYASEQREYVREVADRLRARNIRVFFDQFETVTLWGKNLYDHLDHIYRDAARYCVLFASADYARKVWTSHERRSAQARSLTEHREYVLPVRFDDTDIPGLPPTIAFVDVRSVTPDRLAAMIAAKIGTPPGASIPELPPRPARRWPASSPRRTTLLLAAAVGVAAAAIALSTSIPERWWAAQPVPPSHSGTATSAPATRVSSPAGTGAKGVISSPPDKANVTTCAYFAGTASLPPGSTLILVKSNLTTGAPAKYVERVFDWDEPRKLTSWRGAQYFGKPNEAIGQRYRIELMAVDLAAVRAAREATSAGATDELAARGRILDTRTVVRVAGQAPDDCPGP